MPSSTNARPSANYSWFSFLLLVVFFIGFFPSLFNYLIFLPWTLVFPPSTPASPRSTPPSSSPAEINMSWSQKQFTLPARSRGSYLITDHIVDSLPEIRDYKVGLLNLFVQHTSCALSLNENWDDDVRADMSDALDRIAPESGPKGQELYRHSAEGPDDMPAHIKSALIGASVTIPIKDGKLVGFMLPFLQYTTSRNRGIWADETCCRLPVHGKAFGISSSGQ
jgi:secondary thiamine-phosphate synthase enzyme